MFDCPVIGVPTPDITWYKDGVQLDVEDFPHMRLRQDGRRLEILTAGVDDTGMYECRAENEAGTDEISFEFKVYGVLYLLHHMLPILCHHIKNTLC